MNKLKYFLFLSLFFLFTGKANAEDLNIRIEQPKSPTNQNTFKINFVAMDVSGRDITVQCFKKSPGDGSYSQFGGNIGLAGGGNSGNCEVTGDIIKNEGTYSFFVESHTSIESLQSQTVSVTYKTGGPDAPVSYDRDRVNSCENRIRFKTASDNKTVKVEIYRSDKTDFTADANTRTGTVNTGPGENGTFTENVPDCAKTYYYAIRSFDDAGNGSSVIGDTVIVYISVTPGVSNPTLTIGAIPLYQKTSEKTGEISPTITVNENKGNILGESTVSAVKTDEQVVVSRTEKTPDMEKKAVENNTYAYLLIIGGIILASLAVFFGFRKKNTI